MIEVLSGFSVIWIIIMVGFIAGKTGVLGPQGQQVLSRTAFFIASPALLFSTLSDADVASVLGPQLWIATISAFTVMGLYLVTAKYFLPARKGSEKVIASLGAAMVNSANLGLPIASYVLGSAALAAPVIMFQLAILTPVYVFTMDTLTQKEDPTIRRVRRGFWHAAFGIILTIIRNPMIIGSAAGLIFSVNDWQLWEPVNDAVNHIAGASIPAMLLAFGVSLVGSKPLDKNSGRRREVLVASIFKLLIHPIIVWLLAMYVFQLDTVGVMAATILGSLPAAQNTFVAATRYNAGIIVAKDTVLVTTIAAIPAMILVAVVLA